MLMMEKLSIACAFAMLVVVVANEDLNLMNAAAEGNLTLVNKALVSGANPNWQPSGGSWPMVTALIRAAAKNYVEIVTALLNAGADPNLQEYRGITALNEAAYHGNVDVVPILISHGADVNAYGSNTPLMRTIHLNQVDIARVLLNHGADSSIIDDRGKTVADYARDRGHYRLANLIETFDVSSVTVDNFIITVTYSSAFDNKEHELFNAAHEGFLSIVKKALAAGADFNWRYQEVYGETPLMVASENDYAEIVLALLTASADPNIQDNRGNSALHEAAYIGSLTVLPILLSHGADVDLKNNNGFTALTKSAQCLVCGGYWEDVARILLKNGADPNATDKDGMTIEQLLRSKGSIMHANFITDIIMNIVNKNLIDSTSQPKLLVMTTPSDSNVKASSSTNLEAYKTTSTEINPFNQPSTIPSNHANDLYLPNRFTVACVAVVSLVILMY